MMQQQQTSNDVPTIGMMNLPPIDLTPPSAPLLLTLPNTTTSSDMGPPMNTLRETSNVVANPPMVPQKKSLIDITPIPSRNVDHYQVNMMNQGQSSNPLSYQVRNPKLTSKSMGPQHNQQPQQPQQPPQVMQPSTIPNPQHTQGPLGTSMTYQ